MHGAFRVYDGDEAYANSGAWKGELIKRLGGIVLPIFLNQTFRVNVSA